MWILATTGLIVNVSPAVTRCIVVDERNAAPNTEGRVLAVFNQPDTAETDCTELLADWMPLDQAKVVRSYLYQRLKDGEEAVDMKELVAYVRANYTDNG
jgi:hypothetical protein